MSKRAWVTLATNDSYGLGALVLSHSLKRSGSAYPAVVLITPTVTEAMRERLRAVFAEVVIVDVLDSKDAAHLALLQRPELGITFTKLHCWNLTQYDKAVFLDADTLVVQNCDELFEREELSAAPDVGWPDCFNSGVFVFKPSSETFNSLIKFAQERGSFDGGDQGLLNAYFSDWAHGDINKHLPFLYNVTSAAFYSYLPALKHYGQNLKIIHFIGAAKPWLQQFNWETRTTDAPQHLREFLQQWWDIFVAHVHSVLDISMVEIEESLPVVNPQESFFHTERNLDYSHYEVILDPESEFPWHHPDTQTQDAEINVPEIDMTQYHDPWEFYRGNIPLTGEDSSSRRPESRKSDNHEEIRNVVWDFISPQHNLPGGRSDIQSIWQDDQRQEQSETFDQSHEGFRESVWDYNPKLNSDQQYSANIYQHSHDSCQKHHNDQYLAHHPNEHHQNQCSQENTNYESSEYSQHHSTEPSSVYQTVNSTVQTSVYQSCFSSFSQEEESHYPTHLQQNRTEQVYRVHLDNEKMRSCEHQKSQNNESMTEACVNGYGEADNDIFENIRPRHPYDGFYLKHRMTIDSRGRKVCTHEVPPTPTPTPPESPIPDFSLQQFEDEMEREKQSSDTEAAQVSSSLKDVDKIQETGVAGNFARVVLGAGAQREALDDLTRRQGWEAGNIDYLGADAFDNIWAKISQTLNQPRASSPKESTPLPAEVPAPAPVAPAPVSPVAVDPPVSETIASIPKPTVEATEPPKTEVPEAKAPASPTPTVATEPAKVVAAVASAEPKPAAEAPDVKTPAAAKSDLPDKLPAAIPSENSEVKKDAVQTPTTPIAAKPIKPVTPPTEVTSKESASTDSPPLANTPSKEEIPAVPVAKSEERRKPAGKLQLPPAAADPLPTPDSELEDAAALAHAIIAGELTPAITSPSPPALPASPHPPLQHERLSDTEPPTPPAVSLSQIGIKPQPKASIAAQIESSVSEAAPKKKVVKKVLKKEGGGDAPVPPPRKKEKKPKDK